MDVLLFFQGEWGNHILSQELAKRISPDRVAVCRNFEDLVEKLRSQKTRPRVAVLWVHDDVTMQALVQTRGLLEDVSLVLVLPNQDREILNQAHLLRPRYIDFFDDNGEKLSSVLERMIPHEASC